MKSRSLKPAVLVLAAVLILALLAAIVITQTARSRAEQAITLPGASYAPEEQPQTSTGESLAEITPQNVQAVLTQTLARPTFYHQILTAALRADETKASKSSSLRRNFSSLLYKNRDSCSRFLWIRGANPIGCTPYGVVSILRRTVSPQIDYIMFSKISIFLESAVRVTIAFLMSERLPT